jgi:hypothetical protein
MFDKYSKTLFSIFNILLKKLDKLQVSYDTLNDTLMLIFLKYSWIFKILSFKLYISIINQHKIKICFYIYINK